MSNALKPAAELSVATILLALLPLAGLAVITQGSTRALAAEPVAFTIPAEDGYGIADCMQPGSACGAAMANSWCEAHGHLKAVAFGSAADVTGAVPGGAATPSSPGDVLIRCGD